MSKLTNKHIDGITRPFQIKQYGYYCESMEERLFIYNNLIGQGYAVFSYVTEGIDTIGDYMKYPYIGVGTITGYVYVLTDDDSFLQLGKDEFYEKFNITMDPIIVDPYILTETGFKMKF